MSRIGNAPIEIPAGVTVTVGEDNLVKVKGPKGELSRHIHQDMKVTVDGAICKVERPSDDKNHRSLHGLSRTLINNMVVGVTEGFSKNLEINGVGYRAQLKGNTLNLSLGFSHPVVVEPPQGIKFECPSANAITVSGIDKEVVGQIAAEIRSFREPEPYKGKGIKYAGEHIRRKEGKAGAKGKK
ncbi:50S ribosomal protein L6 [Selenomonas caprae]|uniref:Large ribosomal subunit protein uL6 n=1 Tax=Selenomonas caprae TaxID=2606905 RepID=A0A5D6WPH0_9FIRM|nr:50S ribosomal protein L6 [Selenomonas caprae]TYZ30481.1 50S ribosomal protein L6 [Selenomonas caprae]SFT64662.1 large subunit ribosomal protein L6 [Selenomonas ruminantium]